MGIEYDYTGSTKVGGHLSGQQCDKPGAGNTGKYLVTGL